MRHTYRGSYHERKQQCFFSTKRHRCGWHVGAQKSYRHRGAERDGTDQHHFSAAKHKPAAEPWAEHQYNGLTAIIKTDVGHSRYDTHRTHLTACITHRSQLTAKDIDVTVRTIFDEMSRVLAGGGRSEIRGFGSFVIRLAARWTQQSLDRMNFSYTQHSRCSSASGY